MLTIYAGKNALKTIEKHGFKQELFTHFLGASGGPKWFTLFGLDKYLFGEFFSDRVEPLNLIGSSAGAFRASCFAQNDPVAAIKRLATSYAETVYSDKAPATEITHKANEIIDYTLGTSGVTEIITNPTFKAHFLVNKVNGLAAYENKLIQSLGLAKSIVLNRLGRQRLTNQYQRFVFASPNSHLTINDYCGFDTQYISLSQDNLKAALLASGSIPLVMKGVKNITGAPKGMYRDGGIVDYHFDIEFESQTRLTLYPHFNARPKAGWFDKSLNRDVKPCYYDNTVMLVPSAKFVNLLPYQKIPDRTDFTQMDATTRIHYWKTVLTETERLADCFHEFITQGFIDNMIPFQPIK